MLRLLLSGVLLCFALSGCDGARAPDAEAETPAVAGTVELVEGDVRFLDRGRRARRPSAGDPIHEGESIETGAGGEVHLRMDDGGYMAVRPATRLRIVNFRAEGDDDDRSVISLLEGSFRSVTGWIAKSRAQRVSIQTPTATIGIRGTDHEPLVIPEGSPLGEPGTYDRVFAGETEIRTQQGAVRVRPDQAGFVPRSGTPRPRVLERIPAAFRPARHETRFAGMHARVQREVETRRDERRRDIDERRRSREEARRTGKSTARPDRDPGKSARDDERRRQEGDRARKDERRKDDRKDVRKDDREDSRKDRDGRQDRAGGKSRAIDDDKRERAKSREERERKANDRQRDRDEKRKTEERPRDRDEKRKSDERRREREDKRKSDDRRPDRDDKRQAERSERGKRE